MGYPCKHTINERFGNVGKHNDPKANATVDRVRCKMFAEKMKTKTKIDDELKIGKV